MTKNDNANLRRKLPRQAFFERATLRLYSEYRKKHSAIRPVNVPGTFASGDQFV